MKLTFDIDETRLPGIKNLERTIVYTLMDALAEFQTARERPNGIEGYVAKRYPFWTAEEQARKVEQVNTRIELAENLRCAIGGTLDPLPDSLTPSKVESFPAGENPFHHDAYHMGHMGTPIASNALIMHENFHDQRAKYIIICNLETGERLSVAFGGPKE
jgi:hypothetical protein